MAKKQAVSERYGDILDYVRWRGDLPFEADPWNEIDGLIIATVTYMNFGENERRFEDGRRASLREIQRSDSFAAYPQREMKYAETKLGTLLQLMAESRRFCDIRILDQVNDVDAARSIQFSATAFEIPNLGIVIGYRGTDSSLVGWKEDFMLSYASPVPAQIAALQYLKKTAELTSGDLVLTGHSKGGNLALYSAAHTDPEIQERLKAIYSYDGPGLDDETIDSEEYLRIKSRVNALVPCESLVGLLLNYHPNYRVVEATDSFIRQHIPFAWKVMGKQFLTSDTVTRKTQLLDHSLHEWMKTCSPEQREFIVTTLFTLLEQKQQKREQAIGQVETALAANSLNDDDLQKMLAFFYRLMTIHIGNTFAEKIRKPLAMAAGELIWKSKDGHAPVIRSNQVDVDNRGFGFRAVMEETIRMAEFTGLNRKDSMHLQLLAEEMLNMVRSVTGEWNATYRILCEGNRFQLLLTTRTLVDSKKRRLLTVPAEMKEEESESFQSRLVQTFNLALHTETDREYNLLCAGERKKAYANTPLAESWVRFEQSVLFRLADNIRIAIHGEVVLMTISKTFAETNMKSAVIEVNSRGEGFTDAIEVTGKMAERNHLGRESSLRLQLFAEEMLNLVRTVTGDMKASFWIERDGNRYDLLLLTNTVMNKKKRALLIASSSSGRNEASEGFLGKLRNALEEARLSSARYGNIVFDRSEVQAGETWDRYEQSVLLSLADEVKITIRGDEVKMIVSKTF